MGTMTVKKFKKCTLACVIWTVFASVVMGMVREIAIDLHTIKRQNSFYLNEQLGRAESTAMVKTETQTWQRRWHEGDAGRWTYHHVGVLAAWTRRGHGEIYLLVSD